MFKIMIQKLNDNSEFISFYNSELLLKILNKTSVENKNIDDTVSSFREVAASCKGCHKQFRN